MARFSTKSVGTSKTTNRASGEAFVMKPVEQLVQIVTTNLMGEPKYYGNVSEQMDEAIVQVASKEPEFILKLAAYCRNELYLRTVSIYLLVKAANTVSCKPFVKKYVSKIIKRADEIYEAMACQLDLFKKPIPNSLKKALKEVFPNFDEYQYAKYNRPTKVKFKDVIKLIHPKEPSEIIKKILDDKLKTPKTWETEVSTKGSTKENWENVIDTVWLRDNKILNYMAMIRNINNINKVGVSEKHWKKVMEAIADLNAVKRSKQLPFRFYSVIKNTTVDDPFKNKELQIALNTALNYSTENLPKLKGKTFTVADTSGSMDSQISRKSKMTCKEIACLMTAMTNKFSETAIAGVFGTNLSVVADLTGNVLQDTTKLCNVNVGWSTNGYLTLWYLNEKKIFCDRIMIFTDEELYGGSINSELEKYKAINPDVKLYIINLNGYGETCVNIRSPNVISVSGWSDKILEFIATYEEGPGTFIEQIRKY